MTHQRVSPRQIRLTAGSVLLQKDVLVAMTQDGAEFFWLTQPCAPPQGSAVAVPMELMALGVVRATVHSLRRTHCSAGVKSYAKVASSVEVDIRWPASHQAPARMPGDVVVTGRKAGSVLFNDTLDTFYLRVYGVRHMLKDHSDSERGIPLPPHGLLFPINRKGSFICTIPQTG